MQGLLSVVRLDGFLNLLERVYDPGFKFEVQHGLEFHETPGWLSSILTSFYVGCLTMVKSI